MASFLLIGGARSASKPICKQNTSLKRFKINDAVNFEPFLQTVYQKLKIYVLDNKIYIKCKALGFMRCVSVQLKKVRCGENSLSEKEGV